MTTTRDLDDALRSLDTTRPEDATISGARAEADLQHILATDPATPATTDRSRTTHPAPSRRTQRVRRGVLVAGLVAATTAGVLVLPPIVGGDSAFASWTAYPTGLSPTQSATAVDYCRELLAQNSPPDASTTQIDDADVAIAERRGSWTQIALTGADGYFANCLTAEPRDGNYSAGSSDQGRLPGPTELTIRSAGTATLDAGDSSGLAGLAGDDVTSVLYRSTDHGDVIATVTNGAWALWFPGDELENISGPDGIEVHVGYTDGSTSTTRLLGKCNKGMSEELC